jgi:hypothetical protein
MGERTETESAINGEEEGVETEKFRSRAYAHREAGMNLTKEREMQTQLITQFIARDTAIMVVAKESGVVVEVQFHLPLLGRWFEGVFLSAYCHTG